MTSPPPAVRAIETRCVQLAAGVRLEHVHHPLGGFIGSNKYMDVVAAHMSGEQRPASVRTNPL